MKTLTMADWYAESVSIWERLWENAWPFIHDKERAQIDGSYHHNGILHSADPAFDGVPKEAWTSIDFNKVVNRHWRVEQQRAPMGKNPSTTWIGEQSKVDVEMAFIIQLTKEMPSQAYGTDPGSVDVGDFGYLEWPFKDHKRAMGDLNWWLASDQMQNVHWLDGSTLNLIRKTDEWESMGVVSIRRQGDGVRVVLVAATRFLYILALVQAYFFPIFNDQGILENVKGGFDPGGLKISSRISQTRWHNWLVNANASSKTHKIERQRLENTGGAFYPSKNECWVAYMASMGITGGEFDQALPSELMEISNNAIEVITREGTKVVIQPLRRLQAILQIGYDLMLSEFGANIPVEEALTRCLLNRRA